MSQRWLGKKKRRVWIITYIMSTNHCGSPLGASGHTLYTLHMLRFTMSLILLMVSTGGFYNLLIVCWEESEVQVHGDTIYMVTRAQQGGTCSGGVHGDTMHVVTRARQGGICSSRV